MHHHSALLKSPTQVASAADPIETIDRVVSASQNLSADAVDLAFAFINEVARKAVGVSLLLVGFSTCLRLGRHLFQKRRHIDL
eukprot:XP_001708372.1 Hypothetical protein GL50803_36580 [Giardia lamblia ATCC 50803]